AAGSTIPTTVNLPILIGASTTSTNIRDNLNTIPELNGNIAVTGPNGGPFTVTFINTLAGVNVNQIVSGTTGSATVTTAVNGFTNVSVSGPDGGPFTITYSGQLSGINTSGLVVTTSGGVNAAVTTIQEGGLTSTDLLAALTQIPDLSKTIALTASTTINSTTVNMPSTTNVIVGMLVTGPGIPANTTVSAVSPSSITISNAA